MWRNRGCHTDCNTFRTVDQKIRHLDRKYDRLLLRLIEVRHKINDILVQIRQIRFLCHLLQTRLGISHRSGSVTFNRSKITVSVNERQSLLEVLCHNDQSIINRRISMRMILTHRITYDTRTLTKRLIVTDPKLIHIVERSSLYRLKTVTHIRERSCDNDRHRIIYIGFLHQLRIFGLDDTLFHNQFLSLSTIL